MSKRKSSMSFISILILKMPLGVCQSVHFESACFIDRAFMPLLGVCKRNYAIVRKFFSYHLQRDRYEFAHRVWKFRLGTRQALNLDHVFGV